MIKSYLFLFAAIVCEVFATTFLKKSEQFTLWKPTVISMLGYVLAFYLMSQSLKDLPVGMVYAIWCGVGIVFISLIGIFVFKESIDLPAFIGLLLIILGIVVIQVFSKMTTH